MAPVSHANPTRQGHEAGRSWLWRMSNGFVELGLRSLWGSETPLRLSHADRRRHLYIIGQTGTGKSTLIRSLVAQDIAAGSGVALIDPHGDLAHEVLAHVPRHRVDDVVVLDPSDSARPPAFNPFFRVPKDERALAAANITATFKHIWRDSWGPRLEYILFNCVAAMLDQPDAMRPSFLGIPLLLVDKNYRNRAIDRIEDSRVKAFFTGEFNAWPERQLAEAISPVQNKIGQFLSNPFIRNILGQWRPTVDPRAIMADEKALVVRLPKGLLGDEPANLFGSLIVSSLQQAAMRRTAIPEHERRDFHLHIDEFQNFTTDSFATVLAEARKYGLTLTLGHQYLAQTSETVRAAILGNVGSLVAFRLSAVDADVLAKEIGDYAPRSLRDLARGEIYARLTEGGEAGMACLARTHAAYARRHGHEANILHQSRMRFGNDRENVEARIRKWLG